jgi:hypothetical protein
MTRWRRRYQNERDYDGADWSRDVADYGHDYVDDWNDRLDDAEGSLRNAFSGLLGNRNGRRSSEEERPPRVMRRGVRTEDILEESGFFAVVDKVEELTKKIEELTKAA